MTKLDNICWATNNEYWTIQDKIIDQLIYQPARGYSCTFYYNILYYYYRHKILSFKNNTILDTLDDLRLFTKNWIWYLRWNLNPTMIPITFKKFLDNIPITFKKFLDNRSLSKYIQKASKEI